MTWQHPKRQPRFPHQSSTILPLGKESVTARRVDSIIICTSHHTSRILANLSQFKEPNPNPQPRRSLSWTCTGGRDSSGKSFISHDQRCWGSIISSTGRRVLEATMKKEELEHGTGSDGCGFRQSPSLIKQLYVENRWQNSACSW